MKIAVYAIAKNEEKFVSRAIESAQDADVFVLADTGSTDRTKELARQSGAVVHDVEIDPWRFDTARNAALDLVPDDVDVVVSLDLDEVLLPGWREEIERLWEEGATRVRYGYVWSWNEDGSPALTYMADKIHARHGCWWRLPVHEVLAFEHEERQVWSDKTLIHHHPDGTKPRSQYLPLLKLSVEENPDDDRVRHYYGRELYYYGEHEQAAEQLKIHLQMPSATWDAERMQSMLLLAECEPHWRYQWLMRACAECSYMREPWVALAQTGHRDGDQATAEYGLAMAERIQEARPVYLANPAAYGDRFEELKAQIRG